MWIDFYCKQGIKSKQHEAGTFRTKSVFALSELIKLQEAEIKLGIFCIYFGLQIDLQTESKIT